VTPSDPVAPPAALPAAPAAGAAAAHVAHSGRWIAVGAALLAALCAAALVYAWSTQQRVKGLEQELVRRQLDSGAIASQAQLAAQQAQDSARDSAAKLALLDVRVAEVSTQRLQLEELIQSLSRSRDENVLADVEASIRVAVQQAEITGSATPLVITLKQADERLARQNEPRLERVRRAIGQDLERARATGGVDVSSLVIRLDEAARLVDELPLLSAPQRRSGERAVPPRPATGNAALPVESGASHAADTADTAAAAHAAASAPWGSVFSNGWAAMGERVWAEVRGLVRVTRIDQPEAMLLAPEQAYFLRENLKLRLLNARLALLSRQFDTAQLDLRDAQLSLERYFDRSNKRVASTIELLRQTGAQARQVTVSRPDATLAALAAAAAGR
jgi:uroporphyrin-3 C-methyltransferase